MGLSRSAFFKAGSQQQLPRRQLALLGALADIHVQAEKAVSAQPQPDKFERSCMVPQTCLIHHLLEAKTIPDQMTAQIFALNLSLSAHVISVRTADPRFDEQNMVKETRIRSLTVC